MLSRCSRSPPLMNPQHPASSGARPKTLHRMFSETYHPAYNLPTSPTLPTSPWLVFYSFLLLAEKPQGNQALIFILYYHFLRIFFYGGNDVFMTQARLNTPFFFYHGRSYQRIMTCRSLLERKGKYYTGVSSGKYTHFGMREENYSQRHPPKKNHQRKPKTLW